MEPVTDEQENICKSPLLQKWVFTGFWICWGILLLAVGNANIFWIIWMFFGLGVISMGTDIVLYDEGIELRMWWLKAFVEWSNVERAYYERWVTRVSVKDVTPSNRIMTTFVNLVLGIGISRQCENYDFMAEVFAHRLGDRFISHAKRK